MKKLTISLGCLILTLVFSSLGMASEENPFNKFLKGTYEMTGHFVCSYGSASEPGDAFDQYFRRKVDGGSYDITRQATVTYNGDGTGSSVGYSIQTRQSRTFAGQKPVLIRYLECDFTYDVNADGKSYTTWTTCDSYKDPSLPPITIYGIVSEGKIGPGHQMLIRAGTSRNVESLYQRDMSGGETLISERICGRSGVSMKVH